MARLPGFFIEFNPMKFLLAYFSGILAVLVFIESIHVKAHKDMEVDVHGHCMKNKEGVKRIMAEDY